MTSEIKFGLSESETELVDQLCAEYDPEQYIPQWMRERGSEADWQAYLRVERHEFREEVEVAALVGGMTRRHVAGRTWVVDTDTVLQLFYDFVQPLTRMAPRRWCCLETTSIPTRSDGLTATNELPIHENVPVCIDELRFPRHDLLAERNLLLPDQ